MGSDHLRSEHSEQVALFDWARLQTKYPQLSLMFAIPNGGARHVATAVKLKREGVKRGVPDIFLPVPKGNYHGMFIEMKYGKNRATMEQKEYIQNLIALGYYCVICYSFEQAKGEILGYMQSQKKIEKIK